ncbi:MAG: flavin reductase family protein [Clostridia bacterium]|nr:flavin reductase family protein [Clostridia bacterium]
MAKIKWRGGALLSPVPPAMVTCSHGGKDNVLTIAWTGIVNTIPPKTYISVRPSRFSYNMIKESGVFAINLTTKELVRSADQCGVYTGAKVDKFARFKLTKEPASEIDCPLIAESPLSLECRVTDVIPLGSHHMFIADIVAVDVDDSLIDEKGKLHLERAGLVAYSHGDYFELGKRLGTFGYSVAKKKKR